jgi:hypothetical protein
VDAGVEWPAYEAWDGGCGASGGGCEGGEAWVKIVAVVEVAGAGGRIEVGFGVVEVGWAASGAEAAAEGREEREEWEWRVAALGEVRESSVAE